MNEKRLLLIAEVMKSWLDGGQDVVGLEADYVVEEASEFVGFGLDFNKGTGISLDVINMASNLVLKVLHIEL